MTKNKKPDKKKSKAATGYDAMFSPASPDCWRKPAVTRFGRLMQL